MCIVSCGVCVFFFFQAEDGIRDLVRSRGLGDVYKRQELTLVVNAEQIVEVCRHLKDVQSFVRLSSVTCVDCLLYTSDAADERSSVDLGGRRIIKKKKQQTI